MAPDETAVYVYLLKYNVNLLSFFNLPSSFDLPSIFMFLQERSSISGETWLSFSDTTSFSYTFPDCERLIWPGHGTGSAIFIIANQLQWNC